MNDEEKELAVNNGADLNLSNDIKCGNEGNVNHNDGKVLAFKQLIPGLLSMSVSMVCINFFTPNIYQLVIKYFDGEVSHLQNKIYYEIILSLIYFIGVFSYLKATLTQALCSLVLIMFLGCYLQPCFFFPHSLQYPPNWKLFLIDYGIKNAIVVSFVGLVVIYKRIRRYQG